MSNDGAKDVPADPRPLRLDAPLAIRQTVWKQKREFWKYTPVKETENIAPRD